MSASVFHLFVSVSGHHTSHGLFLYFCFFFFFLHIGDQVVGATIYFENMSSEETNELLKTLSRHKVGLKLQNKDKSPCCSPLSTPCRSPMGTLTWEGSTRFGASSPDIILVSYF